MAMIGRSQNVGKSPRVLADLLAAFVVPCREVYRAY